MVGHVHEGLEPLNYGLAALEQRDSFDGESLLPVARGETTHSRGWALASYSGLTSNTMSWMLRRGDYKLIVHEAYPSRLFNFRDDSGELNDLIEQEPEMASELLAVLDTEVDRKVTLETWGGNTEDTTSRSSSTRPGVACIGTAPTP